MTFLTPELIDRGFEHVSFFYDKKTGLKSIVAIHNTKLGPSLGGCRFYPYPSTEAALRDVMKLAEAMTYKAACADLPLGGGKSVIIGDPAKEKNPDTLKAFGRFVDRLSGTYITTVDSGTVSADMTHVHSTTSHVVGVPNREGGSDDPSPNTAVGVFEGMKACVEFRFGTPDLKGKRVAIQGIGNVGFRLAKMVKAAGGRLALADVNAEKLKTACSELEAESYSTEAILGVDCDVLAPCALGGTINPSSVQAIKAPIIAGAANNQLSDDSVSSLLAEKDILYAPDFVINAGGLIHVVLDLKILTEAQVDEKTRNIGKTLGLIFERAKKLGKGTHDVAIDLAKEKLSA